MRDPTFSGQPEPNLKRASLLDLRGTTYADPMLFGDDIDYCPPEMLTGSLGSLQMRSSQNSLFDSGGIMTQSSELLNVRNLGLMVSVCSYVWCCWFNNDNVDDDDKPFWLRIIRAVVPKSFESSFLVTLLVDDDPQPTDWLSHLTYWNLIWFCANARLRATLTGPVFSCIVGSCDYEARPFRYIHASTINIVITLVW